MWQLFTGAVVLFFKGRLFSDQREAYLRISYAAAVTAAVGCAAILGGAPGWAAALAGGIAGGIAGPILCTNLRMR